VVERHAAISLNEFIIRPSWRGVLTVGAWLFLIPHYYEALLPRRSVRGPSNSCLPRAAHRHGNHPGKFFGS